MPKLVITDGDGVREMPLADETKVGRLADNAIQLKVAEASRHHCRFFKEKEAWFVEDLGSSNGTLVNGRKVSKFELQDGDVISIGAASMKFLDVEVAAPAVAEGWGDDDEITLDVETFLILGMKDRRGEVVKLSGDRVGVGRTKKNMLALADVSVSGEHAELVKRGDKWFVRDLMSSNGTFVDGEKVKESELRSGQVLRFGLIDARFCVGKPKDFSPPADTETADTETFVAEGGGADLGDATFELHEGATKAASGGGAGALVAVLLLLGIGGGAAFFYMSREGGPGGGDGVEAVRAHRDQNLVASEWWSFEPRRDAEEAKGGWRKEDPLDRATFEETATDAFSGSGCGVISRGPDAVGPTYVVLDTGSDLSATPGKWYRLAAQVRISPQSTAAGGPCVFWYGAPPEGETEPRLVFRDVAPGSAAEGWSETQAFVQAPDGATRLRVGLCAFGEGEVAVDDVVLESADAPAAGAAEIQNFRAVLTAAGALRISRFGRPVCDGAGIWRFQKGAEPVEPWATVRPREGTAVGAALGFVRGAGDVGATFSKTDGEIVVGWTLPSDQSEVSLGVPLPGRAQELNATVFDGDLASRKRAAFESVDATALMAGDSGDRVRFDFVDSSGAALKVGLTVVPYGERVVLRVDARGAPYVGMKARFAFDAERRAAQEILAKAGEALRSGRDGEAMKLYEDALARYAFDESVEREATQRREQALAEARKRLAALTARVDDALFFRTARGDETLAQDLAAEVARTKGTDVASSVDALAKRFEKARAESATQRAESEAATALRRAQDYEALAGPRVQTALVFYESVARRFPETEAGKAAASAVERLKAR
jgi:pSer/pThr/pTyr-binding forkhead associated (FHA) protein